MFIVWMRINNPGAYIMPTTRALGGSRQDLCCQGAPNLFINHGYYVDFLMERLCVTYNILQNNLFVILQTVKMRSVIRFNGIVYIDIGITIICLTTKTHELGEYNWSIFLIGRLLHTLYDVCIVIQKDVRKCLTKI